MRTAGRWFNRAKKQQKYLMSKEDAVLIHSFDSDAKLQQATPAPLDHAFAKSVLQRKLLALEEVRSLLSSVPDIQGERSVPGIVVIGSQNAGKSSLLESLSGLSFPRGEGMCTRCPTIVSLECDPSMTHPTVVIATDAAYSTHRRVIRLVSADDMATFRAEIQRLMHLVSNDGAVSKSPVYVRVVRSSGITLTMCDLPGITAMSSLQSDIEEATTELTTEWAANKNMILLCAVPASEDFHNSKALKIALQHDPRGLRTIGVVTKCDTLPPSGDFAQQMRMERSADVKLERHGFIAVRNRTQEESERGASAEELWIAENQLFTSHPQLSKLPEGMWGVGTLVRKLQALQIEQLDEFVPPLCAELRHQAMDASAELKTLPPVAETNEQRRWRLLEIVQACNNQFQELITATDTSAERQLHVAARSHELCGAFVRRVSERVPNFLSDGCLAELLAQVGETRGVYLPNFLHGSVFRRVVKQTFEEPLREAALLLVEELSATVKTALSALLAVNASAHPALLERLDGLTRAIVDDEQERAASLVREKVEAEMSSPFTLNREYEALLAQFDQLLNGWGGPGQSTPDGTLENRFFPPEFVRAAAEDIKRSGGGGGAERAMTRRLQVSLHAYQHVLQARLFDSIPIDVRHCIMFRLHARLAPTLLRDEPVLMPLLGEERPEVAVQRASAKKRLQALNAAIEKLEQADAATATPHKTPFSGAKTASPRRFSPGDIMASVHSGVGAIGSPHSSPSRELRAEEASGEINLGGKQRGIDITSGRISATSFI